MSETRSPASLRLRLRFRSWFGPPALPDILAFQPEAGSESESPVRSGLSPPAAAPPSPGPPPPNRRRIAPPAAEPPPPAAAAPSPSPAAGLLPVADSHGGGHRPRLTGKTVL